MQQPGILQPAKADSTSIGRRRFTEQRPQQLSVASPWWVSNKSHKGSSCRRNAKPICNRHGVCGTYLPQQCPPIVVWPHSNDSVVIHTVHMSVTRSDVTPRNASLGLWRLYSGFQLYFRISSVLLTSMRDLRREGTRSFGAIKPV